MRGINRRRFLQLGGSAALGFAMRPQLILAQAAHSAPGLEMLSSGYPRAFVFRQAEVLANLRSYHEWEADFLPLQGILGKVLFEERTDTVSARNAAYFAKFKHRNPGKLVLAHVNGQACLPGFVGERWWPGFWLYRAGSALTSSLPPEATSATVEDPTRFDLNREAFGERWADLVISSVDADGRPDFASFEHVRMTAVDVPGSTLSITRGMHGTAPTTFAAGDYVAQVANGGRWSPADDYVWLYNLSTAAPRDPDGRSATDALIEILGARFSGRGDLAHLDGIQLDAFSGSPGRHAGIDADLDGVADDGIIDGTDVYELGALEYVRRLRELLGASRFVLTDGGGLQRPLPGAVNGIEEEGFPSTADFEIAGWSEALNILAFWRDTARSPAVSYPMYKFRYPHSNPVSYPRFRLALAAALFTDSAFTYYDEPGGGSLIGIAQDTPDTGSFPNRFTIWDELVAGQRDRPNWLGAPAGPALHLAEQESDLLAGKGVSLGHTFVAGFSGPHLRFRRRTGNPPPSLLVTPTRPLDRISFDWVGVSSAGDDLVLAFDVAADALTEYPPTVPRRLEIAASGEATAGPVAQSVLVDTRWRHVTLQFLGVGPGQVRFSFSIDGGERLHLRAIRAHPGADAICRPFRKGAVFANPGSAPYSFDVAALFPSRELKRINGTPEQDPGTNDGSTLGETLLLPALDALLVADA